VIVKINDRGPFVGHRLIDLSPAAFDAIGALGQGVMKVHLKILG
jgi:rare lipoprotein A